MANQQFSRINHDLLAEILTRVDHGPTLAAANCVSTEFHAVSQQESLWENLCHSTWPSTKEEIAHNLISSLGGFSKFYADSFPLILYKPTEKNPDINPTPVSPSDFVTLVDLYYKQTCIFSRVVDGIPGADDVFVNCPFKLDLLRYQQNGTSNNSSNPFYDNYDDDGHEFDDEDDIRGTLPSVPLVYRKERWGGKLCSELQADVRLSWVLLNKKSGKAVNLSSWRPLMVQKNWPTEGDVVMRFGCAVPAEEGSARGESTECVISVRCQLLERKGCLRWTEISLLVEDMAGVYVSLKRSLVVLERALRCCRTRNRWVVQKGYGEFCRQQKETMAKKIRNEVVAEKLRVFSVLVVFAVLCYFILR